MTDTSFLQWNWSNLKLNIISFWKGKCRKHYFRISIVNALPVNSHPTAIAVDGCTSFMANVNGPLETLISWPFMLKRTLTLRPNLQVQRHTLFVNSSSVLISFCDDNRHNWYHFEITEFSVWDRSSMCVNILPSNSQATRKPWWVAGEISKAQGLARFATLNLTLLKFKLCFQSHHVVNDDGQKVVPF